MKNVSAKFLLVFLLIAMRFTLAAQNIFFGNVCIGYGLPVVCDELNSNYEQDSLGNVYDEGIYGSYGSGINAGLNIGYDFCANGGAQLGFAWFNGKKYEYYDRETGFFNIDGLYTEQAKGIFVEPQLRLFTSNAEHAIRWHGRLGLIIPVSSKFIMTIDETYDDSYSTTVVAAQWEAKGKINLGFTGAAGGTYQLNDRFGIFAEVYVRSLNLSWKSAELTEYTSTYTSSFGGDPIVTDLADLNVADMEIEFVDVITEDDNQDEDQPTRELRDFDPFSSAGLNLGLELRF